MDITENRVFIAALVALGHWVVATPAVAEDAESENDRLAHEADEAARHKTVAERSFSDRPIHLLANTGFGTLVGNVGFTAGYSVHNRFELGGGIGVNGAGLMGGPYLRVRPLVRTRPSGELDAFAVDVGLSVGGYEWREGGLFSAMSHTPADERPEYRAERALFLQVELSWEMITTDGIMVRLGGGGTGLLNPGDIECVAPGGESGQSCGYSPTLFLVAVGSFGFAF